MQAPRVCTAPFLLPEDVLDYRSPAGQEAIDLGESAGVYLDPWQQLCVHVACTEAANGNWAALEFAILVARQNGKGEILLVLEMAWLFIFEDELIIHTAHEFKTASEAFLRLKNVIDSNAFLSRRIRQEFTSHGEEGYVLTDGRRLRFLARSRSSGRGFTGDKVILDEAQNLPTLAMDALLPTLSSRANPQVVYAGTVPKPDKEDADFWTRTRDRGRKAKAKRLAWLEFNHGERVPVEARYDGADLDLLAKRDRIWTEMIVAGNPALGFRMNWDFIETEREALSYMGFIRERLNIWSSDPVDMVIDADTWDLMGLDEENATDVETSYVGRFAIAVDCPPQLPSTAIGAMGRRQDGHWLADVIEEHPGSAWVPTRIGELVRKNESIAAVVVDPASPAGALIPDIEAEGVEVLQVSTRQHAQACGMLYARAYARSDEGSAQPSLHHLGQDNLTDALRAATKRPGPEGTWLWNRKDSGDNISPLVAVTLAGYGLSTLPEEVSDPWGFYS